MQSLGDGLRARSEHSRALFPDLCTGSVRVRQGAFRCARAPARLPFRCRRVSTVPRDPVRCPLWAIHYSCAPDVPSHCLCRRNQRDCADALLAAGGGCGAPGAYIDSIRCASERLHPKSMFQRAHRTMRCARARAPTRGLRAVRAAETRPPSGPQILHCRLVFGAS